MVRHLPQLLHRVARKTGRQVVLSTHSPDLFLDEGISLEEILILTPKGEGTSVQRAASIPEIHHLLDGGAMLMDAILPHTRPPNAHQLALFE